MKKFFIIVFILFFFAVKSFAIGQLALLALKPFMSQTSKKIVVNVVGTAVMAAGLQALYYVFNHAKIERTKDGIPIPQDIGSYGEACIDGDGECPTMYIHDGYFYERTAYHHYERNGGWNICGDRTEPETFVFYQRSGKIYLAQCFGDATETQSSSGIEHRNWYTKVPDSSISYTDTPRVYNEYATATEQEDADVILPVDLDLDLPLGENVQNWYDTLKPMNDALTIEQVRDLVNGIVAGLPGNVTDDLSLQDQDTINDYINQDDNVSTLPLNPEGTAITVEIENPPIPATPSLTLPETPVFDTNIDVPEQQDFTLPISNFIDNYLSNLPFLNIIHSFTINTDNAKSVYTVNAGSYSFDVDFSSFGWFFALIRTILLFVASVASIFIIVGVRGE